MVSISGRDPRSQSALATCGSILLGDGNAVDNEVETALRRRNLVYAIERHLQANGTALDPVTRALLAASREVIASTADASATR